MGSQLSCVGKQSSVTERITELQREVLQLNEQLSQLQQISPSPDCSQMVLSATSPRTDGEGGDGVISPCPWSPNELHRIVCTFPKATQNPAEFMEKFQTIMYCYKLTPQHVQELMKAIFRQEYDDWKSIMAIPDNNLWTEGEALVCVHRIRGAVQNMAEGEACLSNITKCKQHVDETVEQFIERYNLVWDLNSGKFKHLTTFQVSIFVRNLRSSLGKRLEKMMLNWSSSSVQEVQLMALNLERQSCADRRQSLYYAKVHKSATTQKTSKDRSGCFICGSQSHRIRDCPLNKRQASVGSQRDRKRTGLSTEESQMCEAN